MSTTPWSPTEHILPSCKKALQLWIMSSIILGAFRRIYCWQETVLVPTSVLPSCRTSHILHLMSQKSSLTPNSKLLFLSLHGLASRPIFRVHIVIYTKTSSRQPRLESGDWTIWLAARRAPMLKLWQHRQAGGIMPKSNSYYALQAQMKCWSTQSVSGSTSTRYAPSPFKSFQSAPKPSCLLNELTSSSTN